MDKRKEIENYILNEFHAIDDKTFLYQLHENSFFDKEKFTTLLNNCNVLAREYCELGKSENYNEIIKSILVIFEYTFFSLFNHFVENDMFTISNYGTDLTANDVSEYYFQIRAITQQIIL